VAGGGAVGVKSENLPREECGYLSGTAH